MWQEAWNHALVRCAARSCLDRAVLMRGAARTARVDPTSNLASALWQVYDMHLAHTPGPLAEC
jgi:hypothetical protein